MKSKTSVTKENTDKLNIKSLNPFYFKVCYKESKKTIKKMEGKFAYYIFGKGHFQNI